MRKFRPDIVDPGADMPPVGLEFLLARSSRADAAAKPRQGPAKPEQPRHAVSQLCQFDLQLALFRGGALCEDIQDQDRPVDDAHTQRFLEITDLRTGQFIVENDGVRNAVRTHGSQFFYLAFADIRRWPRLFHALHDKTGRLAAGGFRERFQFIKRPLCVPFSKIHTDQDRCEMVFSLYFVVLCKIDHL